LKIYAEVESLAERVGAVISIPRLAGHQKHRGNIVSENAQQYFRRNVAIPFVDNIKEQLDSRFSVHDRVASSLFDRLPRNFISKNDQELDELVKSLLFWDEDIDTPSSLRSEIGRWKRHWDKIHEKKQDLPMNLLTCLASTDVDIFPNVHKLLVIGCTLPVGSVEAERSFSALRQTFLRNSMGEERLAGLALMHMHHKISVDTDAIIKLFIQKNPRRLFSASAFQ
jgi:hypothetical protein